MTSSVTGSHFTLTHFQENTYEQQNTYKHLNMKMMELIGKTKKTKHRCDQREWELEATTNNVIHVE